ncbi:hypothetical protein IH992_08970 [Candidatus Poribacteria bacterium]|nr:hypothetical protein [Candidatus Poribacteria bacterium]
MSLREMNNAASEGFVVGTASSTPVAHFDWLLTTPDHHGDLSFIFYDSSATGHAVSTFVSMLSSRGFIQTGIAPLRGENDQLEYTVAELESRDLDEEESFIIIRDVPREQAKNEIKQLLLSSPIPLDYGEILEKLGLDLELIVEVCDELIEEGIIEFNESGPNVV